MKAGDKVYVADGSWSYEIIDGILMPSSGVALGLRKKKSWIIVTTHLNLKLPTCKSGLDDVPDNNTILTDKGGRVVFIHSDFLRHANCPTCGRARND